MYEDRNVTYNDRNLMYNDRNLEYANRNPEYVNRYFMYKVNSLGARGLSPVAMYPHPITP